MSSSSALQTVSPDAVTYTTWCRRLIADDRKAFEALFHATSDSLYRYAFLHTRHGDVAEDIVQEAFLRIWLNRAALDPDRSLRALLYVTVRNLALSHTRGAIKRHTLLNTMDKPVLPFTPEETTRAHILGDHIRRWIHELPNRRREAFQLSRFDGLSYDEIAHVMDLSVKTVDNHIWKALQHLRNRLQTYETALIQP